MPARQRLLHEALDSRFSNAGNGLSLSQPVADLSDLLATGGDRRILLEPKTGRNRYGTRTMPSSSERSFSSTTASNVSVESFQAAETALARLFTLGSSGNGGIEEWFGDIRARIGSALGCDGAEVILAASGTDVELIAICLLASLSTRPLTNILIAPDETGSGVPMAAAGRHYSDLTALGRSVESGSMIAGITADRVEVRTIAIRDAMCNARTAEEIDADLLAMVAHELDKGRDVLVHVLDTSKTGLTGVTRSAARAAMALAPERVRVIVDACQFRCSSAALRQDLVDGFIVAMTGSKFVAGPPFSGAVLLPATLAEEVPYMAALPEGLGDYTAAQDWPASLRDRMQFTFQSEFNLGLGLRWVAALENLSRCNLIADDRQGIIRRQFVQLVRERVDSIKSLSIHADDDGEHLHTRAIISLTVTDAAGAFASFDQARELHLALRDSNEGPVCHIGQAVHLGRRSVLRVAASALDIIRVAEGMAGGQSIDQAFEPVAFDLDIIFRKWAAVLHRRQDQ